MKVDGRRVQQCARDVFCADNPGDAAVALVALVREDIECAQHVADVLSVVWPIAAPEWSLIMNRSREILARKPKRFLWFQWKGEKDGTNTAYPADDLAQRT